MRQWMKRTIAVTMMLPMVGILVWFVIDSVIKHPPTLRVLCTCFISMAVVISFFMGLYWCLLNWKSKP